MRAVFGTRLGRRAFAACAAALLLCGPLSGGAPPKRRLQGLAPEKVEEIRKLVRAEMAERRIPAISVAVGDDYRLVWSEGFGMADVENSVPATGDTVYRLGSISKPIAAVAVMQLAERGLIDLDASIRRYVPAFPEKPWKVTVRHLLSHTSGVRHYASVAEVNSTRHYANSADPIEIFAADPLLFEPGTKYSYTTYGYCLLGAAIERASGVPIEEYLKKNVFAPAEMETAGVDNLYAIVPHRARGYQITSSGKLANCDLADTSNKIAGGGMLATAGDLVRFVSAFERGRLVKPATVDRMLTPAVLAGGAISQYGLGWFVAERDGGYWFSHSGAQQGVSTYLVALRKQGVSVAVMANLERVSMSALANRIARLVRE
mgnify:CR=1 FL=1